jgi:DNA polymerase-3 subunit delta
MLGAMTSPKSDPREAAQPAALTLVSGAEPFLVSRAVARTLRAARAVDPEVERRDVDAQDPAAEGALLTALSPSLFGGSAVVVVANLADAAAGVLQALTSGLLDLPEQTWVVALHSGVRNRKGYEQLRALDVPGGAQEVSAAAVKRGRATREFLEAEAARSGRRITHDGCDALVMAIGPDIALLVGALEQLMADVPGGRIDASVVTSTFSGVAEVTGFQLADAVWEGHALTALQRLRWGLTSQTVTGAGAVGSLAAGLRAMVKVAGARRGITEAEVARQAGVPPFKVGILRSAAANWDQPRLADAVIRLAEVDAQIKGGLRPGESLEPAQKVAALEGFVMGTGGLQEPVSRPGRAAAEPD